MNGTPRHTPESFPALAAFDAQTLQGALCHDPVPRWTTRRFPCVGQHSVELSGFDGEGYRVYRWDLPLDEAIEPYERLMQRQLDARHAKTDRTAVPRTASLDLSTGLRLLG